MRFVIPSEVEGSRGITARLFRGIPRVRFASLGMTVEGLMLSSFQSTPIHRVGFPGRAFRGHCAFRYIATRRFARTNVEDDRANHYRAERFLLQFRRPRRLDRSRGYVMRARLSIEQLVRLRHNTPAGNRHRGATCA